MRKLITAAALALGLVLLIDVVFCDFTLHVRRQPIGDKPNGFADTTIQSRDGLRLSGWFARPSGVFDNGNCVVVLHGIGDSRRGAAGFAPLFLNAGYSVLMPDSRAHGESGGNVVTYGVLEKHDVVRWAKWARTQGCRKMFGLGESLGGAVLLEAAALEHFEAIVAECAYSDLRSIARYRIRQMTGLRPSIGGPVILETSLIFARFGYGVNLADGSPLESIRTLQTPVLLIHGLDDDRTPYYHSQRLALANPAAQLWLVPLAGHTGAYTAAPAEFRRRVLGWFRRQ